MLTPVSPPAGKLVFAIHAMFFLSGVGALVFENVWFNQLGLIVGNSVWSAALVIGAFMAGLALGNGLAVVLARRWGNLVRGYGMLETAAALSGALLVIAFPSLPAIFRPLLAPFLDDAALLNAIRIVISFALMMIPATALGTTLPLLSKPLEAATGNYGWALGRLYGINTLGAVGGTLLAELVLIPGLGLRHSGLFAAACNLSAAFIALRLARQPVFDASRSTESATAALFGWEGKRIVLAAFLAGGILLALEVIWYRFLLMYLSGYTLIFALMLAVVLAGIGLGGMAASHWARHGWSAGRVARLAAAGGAIGIVAGYAGFEQIWKTAIGIPTESVLPAVLLSAFLMGPVCLISGVLFTALGDQLRGRMNDAAAATGALTLANTLGAMSGSLLGAFALLPGFGVEASFFILGAAYLLAILIIPLRETRRTLRLAPVLAAAFALALFPFGQMTGVHYHHVVERFAERLVTVREGVVETAFYLAHDFLGEPLNHRLVTNAFSMSGTGIQTQRYMKLFVYLPAALHPRIEQALLICFGVGSTASALVELPDVKSIDVVDVSRDILEMSDLVFPDARHHPLRDPRVKVHVEDGRFFLQQTARRYDLITGEPPPPKLAGVASLYSQEYFQLLRDRLNPGGLATYWLPVDQLREREALAIIGAFCGAFEDCTLWSGVGLNWMLMGSRDGIAAVSQEHFSRLWNLPGPGGDLRRIALDAPAQMLAQFMGDATVLRAVAAQVRPLVDNHPRRISSELPTFRAEPLFAWFMDAARSRELLEASPWVAAALPRALIAQSGERFRQRAMLDAVLNPELRPEDYSVWADLERLIRDTALVTWPMWLLESEARKVDIAGRRAARGGAFDPLAAEQLAIDALANRRRLEPPVDQERFQAMTPTGQLVTIFHHCVAGQQAAARSLMGWIPEERRSAEPYRSFFVWATAGCAEN
jgi:predicted membrane-bound spermidine synthase